jgi:cobalt/nickel transport system permease protein
VSTVPVHISFLDPYRPRPSAVHGLDARVKLLLTLAFILATALVPVGAWPVYVLLLALALAAATLSELGVRFVLGRAALALPFALAALPVIFTTPGEALLTLPLGHWTLTVTTSGIERFVSIALKSWVSAQMAIVLAASTSFPDLLLAMRAIRLPRLLVAVFGLMWRYLFVLVDEALRLMRAREARSGVTDITRRGGGAVAWRARVTGGMAGSLFLRAVERSDRVYAAMVARGYDGEVRAFPLPPLALPARLVLIAGLGLLALLTLLGFLLGG